MPKGEKVNAVHWCECGEKSHGKKVGGLYVCDGCKEKTKTQEFIIRQTHCGKKPIEREAKDLEKNKSHQFVSWEENVPIRGIGESLELLERMLRAI